MTAGQSDDKTGSKVKRPDTMGGLQLQRPCPACGNSRAGGCKRVYATREFDVLRCRECDLCFINCVIDDNLGFNLETNVHTDPLLASKGLTDFVQLKVKLHQAGVDTSKGLRLLDVGCGIGTFLLNPQQEGWDVAGLELNPQAAEYAIRTRKLKVRAGSIEGRTEFDSQSFDVVTAFGVIEHLAEPVFAIRECKRLLRPGGFLVLQTPTEDGLLRRLGRALFAASHGLVRFQVKEFYQMSGGHSICFNRRSIRALLERYGFEVIRIVPSTYGLRVLLKRFERASPLKKSVKSAGTALAFGLGKIVGLTNHITVYARSV